MAGERWKEKLAEDKSINAEDAKQIVSELLADHVLLEKKGDEFIGMKEAGRDLKKLKDSLDAAGGDDALKFIADNKDNIEFFKEALEAKNKKEAGELTPEVEKLTELVTGLETKIKDMGVESEKKQLEFQTSVLTAKTEERIANMLTAAASEGIVISDAFLAKFRTEENIKVLSEIIDADDATFGAALGEKVVKPAYELQTAELLKLGVSSEGEKGGEQTITIPGETPGPAGSMFNRGMGRLGIEATPPSGGSWAKMIGTDLVNPQVKTDEGAKE